MRPQKRATRSALVFEWHRWHRHNDIVSQERHQRIEIGGLPSADELHYAEDEDGDLPRRQDLKGRHERKRDPFVLLVAGIRAELHIDRAFRESIGIGLEPNDFAESRRLGRFHIRRPR
jgi:hypothetical protein